MTHLNLNILCFSFGVGVENFQNCLIFQDDYFEYQQPYVIFKLDVLSDNCVPRGQI